MPRILPQQEEANVFGKTIQEEIDARNLRVVSGICENDDEYALYGLVKFVEGKNTTIATSQTDNTVTIGITGSGSSKWTDGGAATYLTAVADDVAIGGTDNTAPFFFDVGASTLTVLGTLAATTVTGANVTSGANPGHTHTGTSLSGIDISDDTNLTATVPIVLTGDTLSHSAANGYVHIPASGASAQILQYSAAGTAKWVTLSADATIADGGAITVANDSHDHTGATLSGIDISDDTNLVVAVPITLTDDTVGISLNANHLEESGGSLQIVADGIDDTLIDWGTGANQVSAVDVPIADAGDKYTATDVEVALQEISAAGISGDHGATTGKGDDDHTQYLLLTGRSGGQSVFGGTGPGDNLEFESASDDIKGEFIFKHPTNDATGAVVRYYKDSVSPAADDVIGQLFFTGKNDNGDDINYGCIEVLSSSVTQGTPPLTEEEGKIRIKGFYGAAEQTFATFAENRLGIGEDDPEYRFHLKGSSITSSSFMIESTDAGSDGPWTVFYHNSATPLDGDSAGHFEFWANNSIGADTPFCRIKAVAQDITDGTADGTLILETFVDGSEEDIIILRSGRLGYRTPTPIYDVDLWADDVQIRGGSATATGSNLIMYHNSPAPGDDDECGNHLFNFKNTASLVKTAGRIQVLSTDVTDGTEDGKMILSTAVAGSLTDILTIDSTLRVRDDTDTTVYLGRTAIGYGGGYSDYAYLSHRDQTAAGNYAMLQNSSGKTFINSSSGQDILFRINNSTKGMLESTGDWGFGQTSPAARIHANKTSSAQGSFVAAGGVIYADNGATGGTNYTYGVMGVGGRIGVVGMGAASGYAGVHGDDNGGTYAGWFSGTCYAIKFTDAGGGYDFYMRNPANEKEMLRHWAIETDGLKTIYSGSGKTNSDKKCIIQLPSWFVALNDIATCTYHLTAIEKLGLLIISRKVTKMGTFEVVSSEADQDFDWQIIVDRGDEIARKSVKDHPIVERIGDIDENRVISMHEVEKRILDKEPSSTEINLVRRKVKDYQIK